MSKIIIVDENNQQIGVKERDSLNHPQDIYRVSALWVNNSKGDVLLAQRSFNKKNQPGLWGPAVSGTVEENETFLSNIIKETEEEIGLTNIQIEKSKLVFYNNKKRRHFTQLFRVKIDIKASDLKIQEDEVEQVKWFSKDDLAKRLEQSPEKFIYSIKRVFAMMEENNE